jgi:hypothetical protein
MNHYSINKSFMPSQHSDCGVIWLDTYLWFSESQFVVVLVFFPEKLFHNSYAQLQTHHNGVRFTCVWRLCASSIFFISRTTVHQSVPFLSLPSLLGLWILSSWEELEKRIKLLKYPQHKRPLLSCWSTTGEDPNSLPWDPVYLPSYQSSEAVTGRRPCSPSPSTLLSPLSRQNHLFFKAHLLSFGTLELPLGI